MAEKPALHLEELNLKYEGENPRNTPTAHESLEAGWFLSKPQAEGACAASRSTPTRTTRGTGEPRRAVRVDPSREKKGLPRLIGGQESISDNNHRLTNGCS